MRFKLYINLILVVFFAVNQINISIAQKKPTKTKQIEAIKLGFISGRLNLTPDESFVFWPLYNDYQKEINSLFKQRKQKRIENANNPTKTVDDDFYFDGQILELKKKYRKAFAAVLPSEKLKKLYEAERDFREELIKQLKNRSEN